MVAINSNWYRQRAEEAMEQAYTGHADNQPYWLACANVYATLALAEAVKEAAP